MPLIGIVTNPKNEEYMKERLSKTFSIENIFFITNQNIENIRNIRFDTVILDSPIKDIAKLKSLLANVNDVILNADLDIDFHILEDLKLMIFSYGFNNKATFTISSISESKMFICLQRMITNKVNKVYEPQEFEVDYDENIEVHNAISIQILLLIYRKNQRFRHIKFTNFEKN